VQRSAGLGRVGRDAAMGAMIMSRPSTRSALTKSLVIALAASLLVAGWGPRVAVASGPTLAQLIGQKLVVRMEGLTPSADLLGRIRRGEVGGIILFGANVTTPTAMIALTAKLRAAAAAGGQPPLLIAVDQEGGSVKRIPWAPPTLSPPEMGRTYSRVARAQGASTGTALRVLGIDVDLAPVADVPSSTSSFMYREGRTFSFSATTTALVANAFATGLESAGVVPTMKHFPGIGFATRNTDSYVVTITASKTALAPGLLPYRTAIGEHIPLIMLSNATYPAFDAHNAAGWSHVIAVTLLRRDLGFTGVTITDSLDGTAQARGLWTRVLAVSAARAGTDMILTTGSELSTRGVYATLLRQAEEGLIPLSTLRASYDRILALKAGL
jgi:beta-N-acetylhexosaminidase